MGQNGQTYAQSAKAPAAAVAVVIAAPRGAGLAQAGKGASDA